MSSIKENLEDIRSRIADAALKCGRNPADVRLLAVSKTFPPADVMEAFEAGQLMFGENRIQELETKVPALPSALEWHLIGHLQSNKAAKAAKLASWIHSIDSVKLVQKLDSSASECNKRINVLLEVNVSGEESKFGIRSYDELLEIASHVKNSPCLELRGLMTMAEFDADEATLRRTFAGLRTCRDKLQDELKMQLPELSMGMSGDFVQAIAEGSTIVRIGTAVFGRR